VRRRQHVPSIPWNVGIGAIEATGPFQQISRHFQHAVRACPVRERAGEDDAPFRHNLEHAVKRTTALHFPVVAAVRIPAISPWIAVAVGSSGCLFPFRFRGQAHVCPLAVRQGVVEAEVDEGMACALLIAAPVTNRSVARTGHKGRELRIGDWITSHIETGKVHAVLRMFIGTAVVFAASHPELAFRHQQELRAILRIDNKGRKHLLQYSRGLCCMRGNRRWCKHRWWSHRGGIGRHRKGGLRKCWWRTV